MVKLFSKNSNLCDHNSPTLQTDRQTDRRHAIAIPRFALKVHRAVIRGMVNDSSPCHLHQLLLLVRYGCYTVIVKVGKNLRTLLHELYFDIFIYSIVDLLVKQESCAIAKMTARCALYKQIVSCCEIWPFEIIQDPPSWICSNRKQRHQIRRPRKPYPRTKHEVDRTTGCGDMAI